MLRRKNDEYTEMKEKYEALKQQVDALQHMQAYLAKGRSWDDTDTKDEEDKKGKNLALMASSEDDRSRISKWYKEKPIPTQVEVISKNIADVELIHELSLTILSHQKSIEMYREVLGLKKEITAYKLIQSNEVALTKQIDALTDEVKDCKRIESLVKNDLKITEVARVKIELKCDAFRKSALIAQDLYNQHSVSGKVAIGFDYAKAAGRYSTNTAIPDSLIVL